MAGPSETAASAKLATVDIGLLLLLRRLHPHTLLLGGARMILCILLFYKLSVFRISVDGFLLVSHRCSFHRKPGLTEAPMWGLIALHRLQRPAPGLPALRGGNLGSRCFHRATASLLFRVVSDYRRDCDFYEATQFNFTRQLRNFTELSRPRTTPDG